MEGVGLGELCPVSWMQCPGSSTHSYEAIMMLCALGMEAFLLLNVFSYKFIIANTFQFTYHVCILTSSSQSVLCSNRAMFTTHSSLAQGNPYFKSSLVLQAKC